jgi:hypothetical protein
MQSHNRALRVCIAMTALFVSLMASPLAPRVLAKRSPAKATCADRLCKHNRPGTKQCWRFHSRQNVSKCFIRRAAQHFHQSRSQAMAIAYRESRYNYRATNSSSGAAGLYQFMSGTWAHTPYRHKSPYHPRWASLAAMWMWAHGGYSHWAV